MEKARRNRGAFQVESSIQGQSIASCIVPYFTSLPSLRSLSHPEAGDPRWAAFRTVHQRPMECIRSRTQVDIARKPRSANRPLNISLQNSTFNRIFDISKGNSQLSSWQFPGVIGHLPFRIRQAQSSLQKTKSREKSKQRRNCKISSRYVTEWVKELLK